MKTELLKQIENVIETNAKNWKAIQNFASYMKGQNEQMLAFIHGLIDGENAKETNEEKELMELLKYENFT